MCDSTKILETILEKHNRLSQDYDELVNKHYDLVAFVNDLLRDHAALTKCHNGLLFVTVITIILLAGLFLFVLYGN